MNILVTGADGFIGKNLVTALECLRDGKDKTRRLPDNSVIMKYDIKTPPELLSVFCSQADFVFHLAGVNRPNEPSEFMEGNFGFTSRLLDMLKKQNNTCPIMVSSSTQAVLDNPYGRSKKAGEELLFDYSSETGTPVMVYRFPNVFGKWCRPNYNSVVATFCHNIANELPIIINDPNTEMNLVYIDDLVGELLNALEGHPTRTGRFCTVPVVHTVRLGTIADLLYSFKASRDERSIPDLSDPFTAKLYATYLSYLPEGMFSYPLNMNCDSRGSFTEMFRTPERGQISVNISKPGIVKGNHWHHTKNEKFIVVSGQGVIRFRRIGDSKVIEYPVSGEKIEVVDIPAGYTHNIENTGDTDMATIMWASECFDPERPDTYFEEV